MPDVINIVQLKDGLSILELFHGDTLAFKDLAMTCTVRFLNYFLQREKRRATVLVGMKLAAVMNNIECGLFFWGGEGGATVVMVTCAYRTVTSLHLHSNVGTSGDTGGSAIQSAKGLCGVDVVVVYPRGRVTPVQEKQMTTCLEDNIHVFAGEHVANCQHLVWSLDRSFSTNGAGPHGSICFYFLLSSCNCTLFAS